MMLMHSIQESGIKSSQYQSFAGLKHLTVETQRCIVIPIGKKHHQNSAVLELLQ